MEKEMTIIQSNIDLTGQKVLEIGCGNGRLTKQLAKIALSVNAIEVEDELIQQNLDSNTFPNIEYLTASATELPFEDEEFDVVVFSLSLCCVEPEEEMKTAVLEAIRVLKPSGYLYNLMPSVVRKFDSGYLWYFIDKEYRGQVVVMDVVSARMALNTLTFDEQIIEFVKEVKFDTVWNYDTVEDLKEKWISRYEQIHVETSDPGHKQLFESTLETYLETAPLEFDIEEELLIFQKPR